MWKESNGFATVLRILLPANWSSLRVNAKRTDNICGVGEMPGGLLVVGKHRAVTEVESGR